MRIVIDASVAVKWVLSETGSDAAVALRDEELIAPALWLAEAANALWRNVRAGQLVAEDAAQALSNLFDAPVASLPMEPYLARALELATALAHPVYDCLYLALALQHDLHVVTADRRFVSVATRPELVGRVRLLGA